ncbi:hypothetical protein Tco_0790719 [Tanacetum coccineum]
MSSITAQQTKLDLELVPKENIIDIRKCNGRIPRELTPRKPTFQVVLDAIAHFFITQCYPDFSFTADGPLNHTGEINLLNDVVVDQMHQPWRTFAALINRVYLERLVVLTTLVSSVLKSWGNPRLNKTYFGHATDEEPVRRKRVKRSCQEKKSSNYSIAGIVFKETPVKTKSTGKEKVDVSRGKGIDLLSEVALAKKAQLKEVRKKSLRDFHKTHPSGSGTVAEKPPSVEKITPTVTSEGTSDKPGVPDVTKDDSTKSESESWEQDEESDDDNQEEEEVDQENESEDDEIESDEDKGMDDTTDQFDDDVDARLKEPTQTDKEVVQGEGADAEMIDAQQGNENLDTTQEQVMRKHGYGYLEEIVVRRADNALYRFKEGDDVVNFDKFHKDVTKSLDQISEKGTRTLHTKTLKDSFMSMTTREQVLASKGTVQCSGKFGKEKSHYNDQGHQQAAKGKEDDEEFGEIRWW